MFWRQTCKNKTIQYRKCLQETVTVPPFVSKISFHLSEISFLNGASYFNVCTIVFVLNLNIKKQLMMFKLRRKQMTVHDDVC